MHTPRIPQFKRRAFGWLKPLMTFAVILVSLMHVWEVIEETFKRGRNNH